MADQRVSSLTFAVRPRVVGKYLGQLNLTVAGLTCVPLLVSLVFHEYSVSQRYLAVILILLTTGLPLARLREPARLLGSEAVCTVTLAFIIVPVLMAYPLMAVGLSFEHAVFEAISGVTTTGLSMLGAVQDRPRSLLFARAWMQWYGGLGIAVLSVALLMGQSVAGKRLVEPLPGEHLATTMHQHAKRILVVYVTLTLIGLGMLWVLTGDWFVGLTIGLTAVSTGGFSSLDRSLGEIESMPALLAISLLSLCGAISLHLFSEASRHGLRKIMNDVELPSLVLLCLFTSALLSMRLVSYGGIPVADAVRHGIVLGVSAQTTTGFSTMEPGHFDAASKAILMAAMAIGGSIGSTAGGIKVIRLLVFLRLVQLGIQRACAPSHAVIEPWLGGRRLTEDEIIRALILAGVFIGLVFLSWLPFLIYGYDPLDALFEVISASATVGLSSGITGETLPPFLQAVLCADMVAGRLEVVALLVVLSPLTWFGRRAEL